MSQEERNSDFTNFTNFPQHTSDRRNQNINNITNENFINNTSNNNHNGFNKSGTKPQTDNNDANGSNTKVINYLAFRMNSLPDYESSTTGSESSYHHRHHHQNSVTFGSRLEDTFPSKDSSEQYLFEYPMVSNASGPNMNPVTQAIKKPEGRSPRPRNYCKLFFKIVIVLVSFAGFLYQATDICAHYFSYRTVVYTNTEQDALVDLPSITFCLPTYFTKKTLEELYSPYIQRNMDETGFKNRSMLDGIKPVIYETFQKQAFKDLSAQEILEKSISDDGIIECRLFYPPQHWPNLTRERMYEIVQYGLPCEEVTQVISSVNANGKCFSFFSQLLTDSDSIRAYQQQQSAEPHMEYQQYPQMTSFATSSASSASTRSSGPVAPPIVQHSNRYMPISHKVSVNHGYRFHSGRFMRLQIQFNREQYTVISDGHQRECIQVHPPFKIPSEACLHSINPGMSYDFVLTKSKAILQPPPYQTNCQSYQAVTAAESELLASTSDPSELKEFYLKPMSRSDCIDKCMIHIYEKHCGCLPIHISIWARSSMYLNLSVCDYEDFEKIAPCLEKELSSTCYDTCKADCIDRHYHLHAESRVYPSDEQIRAATGVEQARLMRLRKTAATISIWSNYLSDITYVHTPAMSLIQLICYLGGLAGLWLGVSVMTVSGWVAQLYPILQKCTTRQRTVAISTRRNIGDFLDTIRNAADRRMSRHEGYSQARVSNQSLAGCLSEQSSLDSTSGQDDHLLRGVCTSPEKSEHIAFREVAPLLKQSSIVSESSAADLDSGVHSVTTSRGAILDEESDDEEDDCCGEGSVGIKLKTRRSGSIFHQHHNSHNNSHNSNNNNNNVIGNHPAIAKLAMLSSAASSTSSSPKIENSSKFRNSSSSKIPLHPSLISARRSSVYWSNYSSMSTSSDDLSLLSSGSSSGNSSGIGSSSFGSSATPPFNTAMRRFSLANPTSKFLPSSRV